MVSLPYLQRSFLIEYKRYRLHQSAGKFVVNRLRIAAGKFFKGNLGCQGRSRQLFLRILTADVFHSAMSRHVMHRARALRKLSKRI